MRLLALLGSTALAAAIELIQPLFSRSSSSRDFLLGFLGILAAIIGSLLWQSFETRLYRFVYGAALIVLSLIIFFPAASKLETLLWASRVFPLLANFETPEELDFWRLNQSALKNKSSFAESDEFASSGRKSLRVALRGSDWPGIIYRGAKDWRGFSQLEFEVFNPGPPFKLGVRVDDYEDCSSHDNRFNQMLDIENGRNILQIPLAEIRSGPRKRSLDMGAISQLVFFMPEENDYAQFFLDNIRLT